MRDEDAHRKLDAITRRLESIYTILEELTEAERRRRLKLDAVLAGTMDPKFLGAVMKNALFEEKARALLLSFVCPDCRGTWTKVSGEPDHSSTCPGCGRVVLPTDEEIARASGEGEPGDGTFTPEEAARFLAEHGQKVE